MYLLQDSASTPAFVLSDSDNDSCDEKMMLTIHSDDQSELVIPDAADASSLSS